MTEVVVPIVVALITVGIPGWVALRKFRKENSSQHAQSYGLLQAIDQRTERTETKIDRHLGWHEAKGDGES